jgi:flagellar basal-body rod modification protein FlgD
MSDIPITGPAQSLSTLDSLRQTQAKTTGASTLDKNAFLKLLVAQLKYQNPMDPSDPTQFMAQTAQFTMVEKLENMDTTTKASNTNQRLALATGLIGKQITYNSGDAGMKTGLVTSARVTSDGTLLRVGTTEITLDMIDTVAPAPVAAAPAPLAAAPAPVAAAPVPTPLSVQTPTQTPAPTAASPTTPSSSAPTA